MPKGKAPPPKTDKGKTDDKSKIKNKDRDCGHSGPGPIYMLPPVLGYPDHDITRYRNPAFTVAGRQTKKPGYATPGPIYDPGEYNRFGAKFSPKVTINKRVYPPRKDFGPGPAAYNAKADLIFPNQPKIALKGRSVPPIKSDGPGPAAYNAKLDILYPTNPTTTIKGRHTTKDTSVGPGPGAYNPGFVGRTPANAMVTGRPKDITKSSGPGPAYNPGYVGPRAPAFSVAGRPDPCVQPYIDKDADGFGEYVPNPQRIPIR
uniref:Outer dense fiber protein 3-like protein 2 n=1 Tax=Lygus hesperus TaxID=30085 RepID=A0A0A9YY38_LYGHE